MLIFFGGGGGEGERKGQLYLCKDALTEVSNTAPNPINLKFLLKKPNPTVPTVIYHCTTTRYVLAADSGVITAPPTQVGQACSHSYRSAVVNMGTGFVDLSVPGQIGVIVTLTCADSIPLT